MKKRVLLVDDSKTALYALSHLFEQSGAFEVVGTATNGADAIALARAKTPDLVTMDVYLELDTRATFDPWSALGRTYRTTTVYVDNTGVTTRCGRCGRDAGVHAWRVYDLTDPMLVAWQGGVLDCGLLDPND